MRGVKDNAVNKYSDQAHFIYELLQNADDTAATTARFELHPNKLVFAHNGTRQFSISDPATEDADSDIGKLGDINSITAYYNSAKRAEASIGKFGIGFKAVLQYTDTPEIHDGKFHFCIKNQIVPVELLNDYPGRQPDETLCAVDTDSHFQLFFDYYNECPPVKVNEFIDLIKEWAFLRSENDKA